MKVKAITPKKGVLEKQAWDAMRKQLKPYVENKLGKVRCPEHDEQPRVTIMGTLKKPEYKIEGCCQQLIDKATEALQ